MKKLTGAALPVLLFAYIFGVLMLGGVSLLAATLPVFTMLFAGIGAWVVMLDAQQSMQNGSRIRS